MGNWLNSWLTDELLVYLNLCLGYSPKGGIGLVTIKVFITTIWTETIKLYRTYHLDLFIQRN